MDIPGFYNQDQRKEIENAEENEETFVRIVACFLITYSPLALECAMVFMVGFF